MTNAEVFEKVFGVEPDTNSVPFYCNSKCPSYDGTLCTGSSPKCYGEEWWEEEFNGEERKLNVKVIAENDCCKQINMEATTVEWLVILKALKCLVKNPEVPIHDRKVAERILNTEPIIEEVGN